MGIIIKSADEIAAMRKAGRVVATVLKRLVEELKPGMKTRELNVIAEQEVANLGAEPSFKGYHGFPASVCVSVNDEIVHGIPGERVLNDGDVVSLDFGAILSDIRGVPSTLKAVSHVRDLLGIAVQAVSEHTESPVRLLLQLP